MLAEKRYLAVSIDMTVSSSSIFRAVSSEGAQKIFVDLDAGNLAADTTDEELYEAATSTPNRALYCRPAPVAKSLMRCENALNEASALSAPSPLCSAA
jgi:hypothetical protein